jgi:RNA recognition motif-containing protein
MHTAGTKMAFESHSHNSSGSGSIDIDNPPFSRVFIVCGRSLTSEDVKDAFSVYGTVEDVRMVKDKITRENKGICFVKFTKASSAAMAIEYLDGKVIGNDSKPIKVRLLHHSSVEFKKKGRNFVRNLVTFYFVIKQYCIYTIRFSWMN